MTCSSCAKDKDCQDFSKQKRSKTGFMSWCKTCVREYDRTRYPKVKHKIRAQAKLRIRQNLDMVVSIKAKTGCTDCGEKDPIVLEFDHLDDKLANVADLAGHGFGVQTIKNEIAKCEVVCANCHRRRTYQRSNLGVTQQQSAWFGTKK